MSKSGLDITARPGTLDIPEGEVSMATHVEHTTVDPRAPEHAGAGSPAPGAGGPGTPGGSGGKRRRDFSVPMIIALIVVLAVAAFFVGLKLWAPDPPTPAPKPAPTAAERAADEAAAIDTITALTAESDKAQQQGTLVGTRYAAYADDRMVDNQAAYIANDVRGGYTTTGNTVIASAEPSSWTRQTLGGGVTRTGVDVCVDISGVRTVDSAGNPVQLVNPDGSPDDRTRKPVTFYVEKRADGSYFVQSTAPAEDRTATC